ncbi:MAG: hypothetical protein J5643_05890 [Lachnospiraceae bacterium]|nr:hypothetical protein [Lachnospiraceae bacterium]
MLHKMSEQEIRIRKISKLRMVSLYEFTGAVRNPETERKNPDGTPRGCTAITVLCDENEQITLSEMDPYFAELCDQALMIYAETKDRESVLMDASTRAVMDAGVSIGEASYTDAFYGTKGSLTPDLSYDAHLGKRFVPLAEHLVTAAEALLERKGQVTDSTTGWRGKGLLQLTTLNEARKLPVLTERTNDTDYRMIIGGYPIASENLHADITVEPERMDVAFASEKTDLAGRWEFQFMIPYMEARLSVSRGGKEICYERNRIQSVNEKEFSERERKLLPDDTNPDVCYRLPWGVIYTLSEKSETFGEIDRKHYQRTFLYPEAGYSETVSWSVIRNTESGVVLKKNNVRMIRNILGDGRCQSFFCTLSGGSNGRYRTELAGKYFIS